MEPRWSTSAGLRLHRLTKSRAMAGHVVEAEVSVERRGATPPAPAARARPAKQKDEQEAPPQEVSPSQADVSRSSALTPSSSPTKESSRDGENRRHRRCLLRLRSSSDADYVVSSSHPAFDDAEDLHIVPVCINALASKAPAPRPLLEQRRPLERPWRASQHCGRRQQVCSGRCR
jgi:hypothetical protein